MEGQEKELEALADMFQSDGWKIFYEKTEDLEKQLVQGAPNGALTNDQWQFARGQILQLRSILSYPDYIEMLRTMPTPDDDSVVGGQDAYTI